MKPRSFSCALLALALASGCSGASAPGLPAPASPGSQPPQAASKIQHVVVLIQENRSFDNLFAKFPGADGATSGLTSSGKKRALVKAPLDNRITPPNEYGIFLTEYDKGKMDGFDRVSFEGHPGTYLYQFVNPSQIKPYWTLARQYVLSDHTFQTQASASFTAHQDLVAGGTQIDADNSLIDVPSDGGNPWGCDAPKGTVTSLITNEGQYLNGKGPFPCLKYRTLRDTLDAAHLTWKYYAPTVGSSFAGNIWNAFEAISAVRYGPEWKSNIGLPTDVLTDVSSGKLPSVAWVCPDFDYSDHPGSATDMGPSWVAQVVNAIGKSRYWNSTAIVVVWDDWGGFYDHVKPPQAGAAAYGFRVPMIVVSPYAKKGLVSHTQYELASVVRFIEENFNLPKLGQKDTRAANFASEFFDFGQAPRTFSPVAAKYSAKFFLERPASGRPLDND